MSLSNGSPHTPRPPFGTRLLRALRRALGPPYPRCPLCGTYILPDDSWIRINRRRYHDECAQRVAPGPLR